MAGRWLARLHPHRYARNLLRCLLCGIVWARVSVVLFALFASHDYPTVQSMLDQIISFQNIEFILVWMGVGFVFASLVLFMPLMVITAPLVGHATWHAYRELVGT